jgi:16S rRNA (cytidine1402-2'-O)-methyltransferase
MENDSTLGTLYIVATPIGNLEDVTLRAVKVLSDVDIVLAEDTRVTGKLLNYINSKLQITNYKENFEKNNRNQNALEGLSVNNSPITDHQSLSQKPMLLSYHQHSNDTRKLEILRHIITGKNIALVTDAGTPGISDPGNELISFLLVSVPDIKIVPIPGPSAITASLSVSGMNVNKFVFLGFLPKKKRSKLFAWLKEGNVPIVFFESPHRILKTLELLQKEFGENTKVFIARELTKMHETLYRGKIAEVVSQLGNGSVKGEIVVVVETGKAKEDKENFETEKQEY